MSLINTVLVKDDLLTYNDKIDFAVEVSGQNVSTQRFTAVSATPTSQVYTINVPSVSTITSREILRHEVFTLTITGTPLADEYLVNVGTNDCLSPLPLHTLTTNMSVQINNSAVSLQTSEVLDPLLRCMDRKRLSAVNNFSPCMLDVYGVYTPIGPANTDGIRPINSPFNGYNYALDPDYQPRGSFVVSVGAQTAGDGINPRSVDVIVEATEPLMISPLVFGDYDNKAPGFTGITQLNITNNIGNVNRVWRYIDRTLNPGTAKPDKKVVLKEYNTPKCWLECRFLTAKPDMVMPSVSVSPYAQYNLFKSVLNTSFDSGEVIPTFVSSNIQLNGCPDMAIIYIRQPLASSAGTYADCYATIKSVSINFNNSSNLCSNFTPQMLWKMSREAGSSQNWSEFSGQAIYSPALNTSGASEQIPPVIGTTGSVVCLKFGEHIALSESWLAPGSMGNYNFQCSVEASNLTGTVMNTPELCVIMVNSGVFTSQAGQSSLYTNLLKKTDVLNAQANDAIPSSELKRLVGSGFLSRLKTLGHHVAKLAVPHLSRLAKEHLGRSDSPLARLAESAIDTGRQVSGYGMSAGNRRLQKHLM